MSRKPLLDPAIKKPGTAILDKLSKARLKPSLTVQAVAAGGTSTWVQVKWTTLLVDGSLSITCDRNRDITTQLAIDEVAMTATATVDIQSVGIHLFDAKGQFLARLSPLGTVELTASGSVYIPF